jgi:DNA-binding MarR family transcriptional regulator
MDEKAFESIDFELAVLVRRITSISSKKISNLDRSAYLILHQITSDGPLGVKALAEAFRLDISTISRQASALEHKGYVYRIPDPMDGRAYSLQITELGKREFKSYQHGRFSIIEEVLKDWTDEELELFGKFLKKYNHSADHYFFKSLE